MSTNFMNGLQRQSNFTRTENGAVALKSTQSPLVDLYATIGAMRSNRTSLIPLLIKSWDEDPLLTMKLIFYTRNIRGGLGERGTSIQAFRWLANNRTDSMRLNLNLIPHFGRWDDLLKLVDTNLRLDVIEIVKSQLLLDVENCTKDKPISLLAKWMPSEQASKKATKIAAKQWIKFLDAKPRQYRKMLSMLRGYLKVTEKYMSKNEWKSINYSEVPSYAMLKYRSAFYRNDETRFKNYIDELKKPVTERSPKVKINANTLYPYDLLRKVMKRFTYVNGIYRGSKEFDPIVQAQWEALPNYVGESENIMVMADTSGSMYGADGLAITTALSLAIYFAERNSGPFAKHFMTFSRTPNLIKIPDGSIYDKYNIVSQYEEVANTNLEAALQLVLDSAISTECTQEELPKSLLIITDMQFDSGTTCHGNMTFHDKMIERYRQSGYEMPNIVYWNVRATTASFQTDKDNYKVQYVSGHSPSVFKSALSCECITPYETMCNTLNDSAYNEVRV